LLTNYFHSKLANAEANTALRRSSRRSAATAPETQSESPPIADPEELCDSFVIGSLFHFLSILLEFSYIPHLALAH
jgi:hypothetical protein